VAGTEECRRSPKLYRSYQVDRHYYTGTRVHFVISLLLISNSNATVHNHSKPNQYLHSSSHRLLESNRTRREQPGCLSPIQGSQLRFTKLHVRESTFSVGTSLTWIESYTLGLIANRIFKPSESAQCSPTKEVSIGVER